MATYYVKTGGSDALSGTSEANAWATYTKAIQTATAGDTVYIAPGTYRNTSGYTHSNAGSSGSPIVFEGDVNCKHFTGENPGYVRITGCDSSEVPTATGSIIDCQKDYVTLRNLVVDGGTGTSNNGVYRASGTERVNENCIALGGYHGFYYGTSTNCIVISGYRGFYDGTQTNCIALGGYYGFRSGTQTNCIALGGYNGFYYGTSTNCIVIGGYYSFYFGTQTNCIALGGYYGFRSGTQTNCIAIGSYYGFYSGTLTNCKVVYCYYNSSGTTGTPTTANHIGFTSLAKLKDIALALKPDLFFEKDFGDDSVSIGTEDILGNPRRQNDNTIDVGPWEYQDREIDWDNYDTNPPGIKLNRKGTELFYLPVKSGVETTITVQVKFDATSSKPSLSASGDSITTQTDTATGDGSSFEELSVTFTPDHDDGIEVRLNANDSTSGDYAIFSDIDVTV